GSLLIVGISLVPKITSFVASIPEAVGYAAIFPIFASIIGLALQSFETVENKKHVFQIVGVSLFAGIGVMFIPSEAFSSMPLTVVSIQIKGLVFSSLIANID